MLARYSHSYAVAGFAMLLSAGLVACGGGVVTTPVATPVPSVTPTASPTAAATSAPATSAIVSGQAIAIPVSGGFSGTVTYTGNAGSGASVTLQSFLGAPSGAPQPQALRASARTAQDLTPAAIASLQAVFNTSITIQIGYSVTLPGLAAGTAVTAETFNQTTGSLIASTGSFVPAGGGAVTFVSTGQSYTFLSTQTYLTMFVVNSRLSASPAPSASATASASAAPSATASASASPSPAATVSPTAPASVTITEVTTQGSLVGLNVSPNNVPYFLDDTNGKIGYLNGSTPIEFPISQPTTRPYGGYFGANGFAQPAFGSDGNLYYPHNNANSIGQLTTAGVSTEFPIPTASAGPIAVVLGPDNALWFTEGTAGKIGRVTMAGAFTEYVLPSGTSAQPQGIVVGPDSALWFTESGAGKIGRITTAGAVTEYPMANPGCVGIGIASGPLNSLWYVGCVGNFVYTIDQVSLTGAQTIYQPPTGFTDADPRFLTAGKDGALWITDQNANQIDRLMPLGAGSGTWTAYTYPLVHGNGAGNAAANWIVTSPDGSFWWSETNTGNVGHLVH